MEVRPGYAKTEVGVIPEEWKVGHLRDVAEIRSGIAVNANSSVSDPVRVHYLRVANVQDGFLDLADMSQLEVSRRELDRFCVLPGDVLMNEGGDRDKLGRGSIWRGEYSPCVHQNHVFVVRCRHSVIPEFLTIWSSGSTARKYFLVAGKQTTNLASINKTSLGALPVILPRESEQRVIVEALNNVDGLLDGLDRLIDKKRDLKQAAMQQLLTGQTRLPFQGTWSTQPLSADVTLISGHHVLAEHCNENGEGVAYLTGPADFPAGRIHHTKFTKRPGTICNASDILVTVKGSGSGTLVLADADYCISRQLMAIRVRAWNYLFIFYSLLQNAANLKAASSGLIPGLSRSDILDQPLPIPPTCAEQAAIAEVLSDMDGEIAALEQRRDKTRDLKQAMMQELLTGRIRLV